MVHVMNTRRAFSLVELSVVLVILGLLAGGVLSGRSLIRASELRATVTEVQRFMTATYSFRDKYFAIPGDMATASQFWTAWSTTGTAASVTGAKNGDGNGLIGSAAESERLQFFRHLSLARLIEGSYAGSYAETVPDYTAVAGVNTPPAKLGKGGLVFVNSAGHAGNPKVYGLTGNYLLVQTSASPFTIVMPEEAWNIDTKIDDGISSSGAMLGIAGGALADRKCSINNDYENAATGATTYSLTETTQACTMLFFLK